MAAAKSKAKGKRKPAAKAAKKPPAKRPTKRKANPRQHPGAKPSESVQSAVRRDLKAIAKTDAVLAKSGLAMTALNLACAIDNVFNSLTSRAMAARALKEVLDQLRELAPPEKETDRVDELAEQRQKRVGGRAAT